MKKYSKFIVNLKIFHNFRQAVYKIFLQYFKTECMVFLPWFNLANFVSKQLIVNLKRHPHVVQDFSNDLVKLLRFYTFSPLNVKWFLKYVAVRIHCFTVILCNCMAVRIPKELPRGEFNWSISIGRTFSRLISHLSTVFFTSTQ